LSVFGTTSFAVRVGPDDLDAPERDEGGAEDDELERLVGQGHGVGGRVDDGREQEASPVVVT
jgi:hypothetical protein